MLFIWYVIEKNINKLCFFLTPEIVTEASVGESNSYLTDVISVIPFLGKKSTYLENV